MLAGAVLAGAVEDGRDITNGPFWPQPVSPEAAKHSASSRKKQRMFISMWTA